MSTTTSGHFNDNNLILGTWKASTTTTTTGEWKFEKQYDVGTTLLRGAAKAAERYCSEHVEKKRISQQGWKSRWELKSL